MTLDLNTFLTALYTIVDDLYQKHYAHLKPRRPGRRPELPDSEVLTLSICAQWFFGAECVDLVVRVAAKLVPLNLGIWLNRLFDCPDVAFATLFNR